MVARQIPESEIPEGCRFKSDSLHFFDLLISIFLHHNSLDSKTIYNLNIYAATLKRLLCIIFAASREV